MSKKIFHLSTTRLLVRVFLILIAFSMVNGFFIHLPVVNAQSSSTGELCGNGSSPDYGFSYDMRQPHWTIGWEGYISENAVNEVDLILDDLNADMIAQTMILVLPQEKVGNRVNCAVHFLRYMQLGQPYGERKDNGFTFLIVVEPSKIDVHYGVGLGLPALTAQELTPLNRSAEEVYQTTGSLDEALVTLIKEFDTTARANYSPLVTASPTPQTVTLPEGGMGIATMCCLLCMVAFVVFIFIWILTRLIRSGVRIGFPDSGSSWGSGGSWNRPSSGGGGWSRPSGGGGGGGWRPPPSRGGSGSGRAGRGN